MPLADAEAAPPSTAPVSAADAALGRALLVAVAAAYGSMTVSLRYVFLLPGPPVRIRHAPHAARRMRFLPPPR